MKWANEMLSRLLNVPHHHIVTTLPIRFRALSKINGDTIHNILFQSSAKAIKDWFDFKYGLKVGIVAVLHTAGSDLKYHPHIHMIVSRGGLNPYSGTYQFPKGQFLCSQRSLAQKFKNVFIQNLMIEYRKGNIKVHKKIHNEKLFKKWLDFNPKKHWIVNIEKPLDDIEQIIGYVGRYTKRACISEYKLQHIDQNKIQFLYNDYKNTPRGQKPLQSIREYTANKFLDLLLQHVPNKGYRMVRYYGLYNSAYLSQIPQQFKKEMSDKSQMDIEQKEDWGEYEALRKSFLRAGKKDPLFCYHCNKDKKLVYIEFKNTIIYNHNLFDDSS